MKHGWNALLKLLALSLAFPLSALAQASQNANAVFGTVSGVPASSVAKSGVQPLFVQLEPEFYPTAFRPFHYHGTVFCWRVSTYQYQRDI
jgi:hypothetical protein